jgi:regulator of RNase E activity RraA
VTDDALPASLVERLSRVSTATLTSQLLRRGFRETFLQGLHPQRPDLKMVGVARTLRYVPSREDRGMRVDYDNRTDIQRIAVEQIQPGEVLVIDARGDLGAASFGHIIATRIMKRGAAGLVTDGALRDRPAFAHLDLPSYCRGSHATTSSVAHLAADMDVPIGCAGVLVVPGDVVVGDAEGVVVIPRSLAAEVAEGAVEQESREDWALERVQAGEAVTDVYPLAPGRSDEYERWKADREI